METGMKKGIDGILNAVSNKHWVEQIVNSALEKKIKPKIFSGFNVSFIVFNTTVIGLLAAFYREKSESLIPPVIIHFLANAVGSAPLIIKMLISGT